MEKRTGWGTEYPDDIRNGDWEYQAFTADKKVNDKAVLANCFKCHKPLDKQDFVFSYDKLKAEFGRPIGHHLGFLAFASHGAPGTGFTRMAPRDGPFRFRSPTGCKKSPIR